MSRLVPILDLDGTLLDTDAALVAVFLELGVPRDRITFGHTLARACAELGIDVDAYIERYDPAAALPFDGVQELLDQLERWAICSNKHPTSGRAELARLGWQPEVVLFADAFGHDAKELGPVLERLRLTARDVVFVGDTEHDQRCALAVGCPFVVAGWNPRTNGLDGDVVLRRPIDLLDVLDRRP